VAYGGAIAQAIMANESQITIVAVATMAETVNQGGAKFLAFSSKERVPQYPDVPTFNEIGFGSYPSSFWLGIAVPAGTPDAIVAKLNAAFVEAAKDPKYQEYLKANALESGPTTIEGFKEFMAKDRAAAETIIQITGVQPK
jgi:tripartite-type tricarboxylate transporter receptor subunit TctC